jgi:hypothetical protein
VAGTPEPPVQDVFPDAAFAESRHKFAAGPAHLAGRDDVPPVCKAGTKLVDFIRGIATMRDSF